MESIERGLGVDEFYNGSCVLVTGASGEIGKVLIEELLRLCPQIDTIYLLIRDKKHLSASQRFEKIINSKLFDKVRDNVHKAKLIKGDMNSADMSLSREDNHLLRTRINVVLHCAASVAFKLTLKNAFLNNIISTKYLLDFCRQIPNLKSVVYMSTSYCNTKVKFEIEEKVYPLPADLEQLERLALNWSNELNPKIDWAGLEKKIIPTYHPNTYVAAKAVSESLVQKAATHLPICIVRPSVVGCCMEEPIRGWVNSISSVTYLILSASIGTICSMVGDPSSIFDLIPLDMVAHSTILAATAVREHENKVKVYHITTGMENPLTMEQLCDDVQRYARISPPEQSIFYSTIIKTTSRLLHFAIYFFYLVMALVVDAILLLGRKKPRVFGLILMSYKMSQIVEWVTSYSYYFSTTNMMELTKRRSTKERDLFKTDVQLIQWDKYIYNFVQGIKEHILHEYYFIDPHTYREQKWLKMQTMTLKSIAACCCCCILYFISKIICLL